MTPLLEAALVARCTTYRIEVQQRYRYWPANSMTVLSMTADAQISPFQPHWDLFPAFYVANRAPASFLSKDIDGDLTKPAWDAAPWSHAFGDIQGDNAPVDALDPARTMFKALWDDEYLYIGAILHPHSAFNTPAHFTERNSPIYQKDSDFEVFVDPTGSNHNYKELEVNAIHTVWNLMLDKPYVNDGREHSARVAVNASDPLYYEVHQQTTATKLLKGKVNGDTGALWSVEMALAFADLNATLPKGGGRPIGNNDNTAPTKVGSHVRINFSRVELQGVVNWTWQPQRIWDAGRQRYTGQVNMHLPESWGYLVFGNDAAVGDSASPEPPRQPIDIDPTWPVRVAVMHVYYAEQQYRELNGRYTLSIADLVPYMDTTYINPFRMQIVRVWVKDGFRVVAADQIAGIVVTVEQDRFLSVMTTAEAESQGVMEEGGTAIDVREQ